LNTWFTADLHLGHARIIELCDRPFRDPADMNETIIQKWNERVAPEDQVYVLGDVALGTLSESLPLVARLHGRKLLVPGNHDRCWPGNRKVRPADVARYERVGFKILPEQLILGGWPGGWLLCHFPAAGDSHDVDRFAGHRPEPVEGQWLLHGHVHQRWRVNGRQVNVGVDVWDFRPVHESEIEAITAGLG
jgi:calcineurin-like phosphoesterase family protein